MKAHLTSIFNQFTLVALLVALISSAVQVIPVHAASIVVNSNEDSDSVNVNDGKCTLREAIIAANSDLPRGGCPAGSAGVDSISFAGNYIITVGSQLPFVTTAMTITGKGWGNTIIQAAATPNTATWRVFQVTLTGNLNLDGVTVRHGRCIGLCTKVGGTLSNAGGGIYNSGTLTVTNSLISNNFGGTPFGGGGIYTDGTLTVINSTFTQNIATHDGGGILNYQGSATVINSTFSGNIADSEAVGAYSGGGISNYGIMTVTNSTFTGNTASYGGGIVNWSGPLTVTNSTIAGNIVEGWGGGILSHGGSTTTLANTIVANNTGNTEGNCSGTIINGGNNLDSDATCGWGTSNGSMSNTDPRLGQLADNGGPTRTMKLLTRFSPSPAIDAGDPAICNSSPVNGVDQRGVLRPLGAGCDIGAFETSLTPGPDTAGVFRPSNGVLFLQNFNANGFADVAINYGIAGDYPVVGDWDGDGTATIGVYRNGQFLLRNSNTIGVADFDFAFGAPGDQPIAGDWNGDGVDTIGVYRSSTGTFYLRNQNSSGPPEMSFVLGNPGDVGIAGDWNGDGFDTTGVFRPSNGVIFLKNINASGFADVALNYGSPGDKPVTGDWNFDGIDTIGIYRNGKFYLRNSNTNGFADMVFALGNPGDMPIAGNWDGQP